MGVSLNPITVTPISLNVTRPTFFDVEHVSSPLKLTCFLESSLLLQHNNLVSHPRCLVTIDAHRR